MKRLHLKLLIKLKHTQQSGMTLIEILIALTLLALAGTFIAGKFFDQLEEGRVKAAQIQMQGFSERMKEFRRHCNQYPTTEQGLNALINKPTVGPECPRYAPNGYIEEAEIPLDPWDLEYVYESDGKTFSIKSYGPDKEAGTEDDIEVPAKKRN